jgi:hypothetical protein
LRANGVAWSAKNLDAEAEYGAMITRIEALISRTARTRGARTTQR